MSDAPVKYEPGSPLLSYRAMHRGRMLLVLFGHTASMLAVSTAVAISPLVDLIGFWPYVLLVIPLMGIWGWFVPRLTRRWTTYEQTMPWLYPAFAADDDLVWALAVNVLKNGRPTWRHECLGESYFAVCPTCKERIEFTPADFIRVDLRWPEYGSLARIHHHE